MGERWVSSKNNSGGEPFARWRWEGLGGPHSGGWTGSGQCRPGRSPHLLGAAGSGEFQAGTQHVFGFSKNCLLCKDWSVR